MGYHVLGIGTWARSADIRRAYLRQGKATLLNCGFTFTKDHSPRNFDDFPEITRKKFQAITTAYEVLSQAKSRTDYDTHGVVYVVESTTNAPRNQHNSVKWMPFVEEKLIVDSHPNEHSHRTPSAAMKEVQEQHGALPEPKVQNVEEEIDIPFKRDLIESFENWNVGSLIEKCGGRKDSMHLIESELNFAERLGGKKNPFHKGHQMTIRLYQEGIDKEDDSAPSLHSLCSVIFGQCIGDMDLILGCGLADTLYNVSGHYDEGSVISQAAK